MIDPTALISLREPLLTAEEEVELGVAIEVGLYAAEVLKSGRPVADTQRADLEAIAAEGRMAFQRFVAANVRLAAWFARRRVAAHANGGLDVDELTSEGIVGVIRAVHKWDYTAGTKFSTYASNWVTNFQAIAALRSGATSCTFADTDNCQRVLAARYELGIELGRPATTSEVAEQLGMTRRAVEDLMVIVTPARSLDEPVGNDGRSTLGDLVASVAADGVDVDPYGEVVDALPRLLAAVLDGRERRIVAELFGLVDGNAKTVGEVAMRLRLPRAAVSKVANAALAKMRCAATTRLAA